MQQLVCVFPLTTPTKQEPPAPEPPASAPSVAPGPASYPLEHVMTNTASPLGGFGWTCQESWSSVAETLVTVIVALDMLGPDSVFGDVFWKVPVKVAV